jgi:Ca-activated chloride channel family protein
MKRICQALLLVFLALSSVAQEPPALRVAIPLIANGSHHQPASVTVESLVITDQNTPVTGANLLRGVDLPVELGVLIDTSNSQRDPYRNNDILKAAKQFLDGVIRNQADRVFLLEFAGTARTTPWLTKEQLQGADIKVGIGGKTALYDALAVACKERMGVRDWRKPTRRVLLLISDGEDNLSHITRDDAVSEALKSGAVIFTIDTDFSGMLYRGLKILEYLATQTGGESFTQVGSKDMPKVLASVQQRIDGMYYLSYVPPDASKDAIHEVEVKPAAKEKFHLSYAREYFWTQ